VDPTVAVGAFLMVKPLSLGRHTIQIVGAAGPLDHPFFVKDITYQIRVVPHRAGNSHHDDDDDCDR